MFQRKLVELNKVFVIVITWKTSSILDKSFLPIHVVKTTQLNALIRKNTTFAKTGLSGSSCDSIRFALCGVDS